MDKEMMKGSIDVLLLSLIAKKDLYGYEMTKKLKELSEDTYDMSEGTLYSALKRMERKGWIWSYWSEPAGGRRKYYSLTETGDKELGRKRKEWATLNELMKRVFEGGSYES
ncbi:PadR family transcriptional regulator [Bacillus piscicola]|uniref:PadR family transcriptional regulator n=1 Tax=Bacillus piscicola TaxID=1632684 RepID=UPI001F08A0DA|nr:helix-turn-helix transcriptional regulator [Bacillus piscicola]